MWISLCHEAWISITANRLRTFLAMLGIVIGVSSVVALVAVGTGSSRAIEESIAKLGSNLLMVTPGARVTNGMSSSDFSELEVEDANAITQLPTVLASAPASRRENFQVVAGRKNWNVEITGATEDFFGIRDWDFAEGAGFTEMDVRRARRVAVIGQTTAVRLFGSTSPVGNSIRVNGMTFKILGLLASKGQNLNGRDQDDVIYMPISTVQRKLLGNQLFNSVPIIFVKVAGAEFIDQTMADIHDLLRKRHRVRPTEPDRFTVRSMSAITETTSATTKALSLLLGAIASISLVVGGIGIMNIMLVTVTERTREIGIRKAIGATKSHVLWQFLLEAIVIAGAGSMIGLIVGFLSSLGLEHWMGMRTEMTIWSIILSLSVAIIIGIVSGLYPAHRAAQLEPIDALRQVGG